MKRHIVPVVILLSVVLTSLGAQTDLFMPPNPITMGMGGAYTANAEGYNAFFYNPAGYARKGEFTLLSVNAYGLLDKVLYNMLVDAASGKNPLDSLGKAGGSKELDAQARATDTSALTAAGISEATATQLTNSMTPLVDYLTAVSKTKDGDAAIAKSLASLAENDPDIANAMISAGIDPKNPAAGGDTNAALGALMPVLLADTSKINTITTKFVASVETNSGVTAPPAAKNAGAGLETALQNINNELMAAFPSGNANVGAMIGIGWVGKGLGVGLFANVTGGLYTPSKKSILSSVARANVVITLAGGLGFNLSDDLSIGFSLRPTFIGYVSFLPASLITGMMSGKAPDATQAIATIVSNGIYKGFRLGVDVGALWDLGDFTLGLAVKDILPLNFVYKKYVNETEFVQDLANFKDAVDMPAAYQVPGLKVNVGVNWHPDLGSFSNVFDPQIGLDVMDIGGWIRQLDGVAGSSAAKAAMMSDYDFLKMINLGAQIKLFKFISLRGGLGQGMANVGLGLNLFVIDINAAVGARYKANPQSITDFSEVGFSVELALLRL